MTSKPVLSTAPPAQQRDVRLLNMLPIGVGFLALLLLVNFLGHVGPALLAFTFAVMVATALNPLARSLERWRPRGLAGFLTVLGVLLVLGLMAALALPPLVTQVQALLGSLPDSTQKLNAQLEHWLARYPQFSTVISPATLGQLGEQVNAGAASLLKTVPQLVSRFAEAGFMGLVTLVMVIFVLSDPVPLLGGLLSAVPVRQRLPAARAISTVLSQLGAWGRATILLMLTTGAIMALGLSFLGIPHALIFGVLAAIGELIPTLGAIVATLPPLLYALADDPHKAVYMLIFALVFHGLESYVLAPFLLGSAGKMHPVSVTVGVLFFGSVFGLVGAFLTVPFLIVIKAVYREFYLRGQEVPEVIAQAMLSGQVEEQFAREEAQRREEQAAQAKRVKELEQQLEQGEIRMKDALEVPAPGSDAHQ